MKMLQTKILQFFCNEADLLYHAPPHLCQQDFNIFSSFQGKKNRNFSTKLPEISRTPLPLCTLPFFRTAAEPGFAPLLSVKNSAAAALEAPRRRIKRQRKRAKLLSPFFLVLLYFAYSTLRNSRMTLTLIWPGYSSSASIFLAMSFARNMAWASSICSGLTMTRTSLPAWMA